MEDAFLPVSAITFYSFYLSGPFCVLYSSNSLWTVQNFIFSETVDGNTLWNGEIWTTTTIHGRTQKRRKTNWTGLNWTGLNWTELLSLLSAPDDLCFCFLSTTTSSPRGIVDHKRIKVFDENESMGQILSLRRGINQLRIRIGIYLVISLRFPVQQTWRTPRINDALIVTE